MVVNTLGKMLLKRYQAIVSEINQLSESLANISRAELLDRSRALRYRSQSEEKPVQLLPEAFALVREAASLSLGMRHFDVQMLGGIALFHGHIAEMETGEGKTLTASLPLYLRGLAGRGAHLATVNDYLAQRDADTLRPLYECLGFSIGCVQSQQQPEERRAAYHADITYGTAKEFGFDFLRDRLSKRLAQEQDDGESNGRDSIKLLQRPAHFCLLDEADSILIDEARTPLILSAVPGGDNDTITKAYRWAAAHAADFNEQEHYKYDAKQKSVTLNATGRELLRRLPAPTAVHSFGLLDRYQFTERAIRAARDYHKDVHYVVRDGEIVIVDEFTGRLGEGRRWQAGLHAAIEAKEQVEIQAAAGHAARVTVQDFFQRYPHLAGMTGSAASARREMKRVYRLGVLKIPTNRPSQRQVLPVRCYATADAKWKEIVHLVQQLLAKQQPVLIGTRTIGHSEHLSTLLTSAGIEHRVLNANRIAEEAEIVAQAGQPNRVTVSTNMAGRGTDIVLGEGVAQQGGLFVIGTELHESARIDRQLAGRCARQGDPGIFQQFMSLEDEILAIALGPKRAKTTSKKSTSLTETGRRAIRILSRAQSRIERRHARNRTILLHAEKERRKLQWEVGHDPYLDSAE